VKAWRNPENQARFRLDTFNTAAPQIGIARAFELAYKGRVGKRMRDSHTRVLPVPSFLLQGLLIRAGLYPAA
jgi:hypothetical protein